MPRLFVAIHPSAETARTISMLTHRLQLPKHRPVSATQSHLTVMYLGERSDGEMPEVESHFDAACSGVEPFSVRPVRALALPANGAKRTVVLECDRPPELLNLHDRLVACFARESRPRTRERFFPHITIARFGGSGERFEIDEPVQVGQFAVTEVRLMSSDLRPDGAVHSIVRSATLSLR